MGLSPAALLVDASGNVVGIVQDGSVYRLQQIGKLLDASGSQINPAKEDGNLATLLSAFNAEDFATQTTLALIKAKTDNLPSDPSREGGKLTALETILTAIRDTAGVKKIVDALPAGTNLMGKVKLVDKDGTYEAQVLSDGRVSIAAITPPPPSGGVAVSRLADGDVNNQETLENIYTITTANHVHLQNFIGGGENTTAGGRIEIVFRDVAVDTLIAVGYIAGGNFQFDLNEVSPTGNGTRYVVIRRINMGGTKMRQTGRWSGYEDTP